MKRIAFAILVSMFVIVTAAISDTLRLRSGATIEGTFLGADTRQIKFLGPDGQPETYSLTEVEGITFAAMSSPAAAASKTPALTSAPPAAPTKVSVPAGTLIFVRVLNSLDTSKTQTGQLFTATLDCEEITMTMVSAGLCGRLSTGAHLARFFTRKKEKAGIPGSGLVNLSWVAGVRSLPWRQSLRNAGHHFWPVLQFADCRANGRRPGSVEAAQTLPSDTQLRVLRSYLTRPVPSATAMRWMPAVSRS